MEMFCNRLWCGFVHLGDKLETLERKGVSTLSRRLLQDSQTIYLCLTIPNAVTPCNAAVTTEWQWLWEMII